MDTLPEVTFETVRQLRRGSATKARRKKYESVSVQNTIRGTSLVAP